MNIPASGLDIEEHLGSHLQLLRAAGQSPATINARHAVVTRARREVGVPLSDATTQQLAAWLARPGWSRATRSIYRYHLCAYLAWQFRAGLSRQDPSAGLAKVRLPRRLPKPVTDRTLSEILSRARDPYRLYILLAAYAGLRCAEIAGLDREDITEDTITVLGKGDKVRRVPTHPLIWRAVADLPLGPIVHFPAVPPERAGRYMSRYCCTYLIRLGFRGVSMHRFRHSFATRLLRSKKRGGAGANTRTVQELLGHASLSSTQIYTEVDSEELRLAVLELPAA